MAISIRLRRGDRVHYYVWRWTGREFERVPREATVRRKWTATTVRLDTSHDGPFVITKSGAMHPGAGKQFTLPISEVTRA